MDNRDDRYQHRQSGERRHVQLSGGRTESFQRSRAQAPSEPSVYSRSRYQQQRQPQGSRQQRGAQQRDGQRAQQRDARLGQQRQASRQQQYGSQQRGQHDQRELQRTTRQPQRQAAQGQRRQRRRMTPDQQRKVLMGHRVTNVCFSIILVLGLVIGLMFFARPTASAVENRNLTKFPEVTLTGLLDGSFFSDVSTWYADTYPLREPLVSMSKAMQSVYGITTDTMMVGGGEADELPTEEQKEQAVDTKAEAEAKAEAARKAEEEAAEAAKEAARKNVEVPSEEKMAADIQNEIMSGLYVKDGAAYSVYYFSQSSVDDYCAAISLAADKLNGKTKVYSVLAPNNSAGKLDDSTLASLGGTDQKKALAYFDSRFNAKVTSVPTLDTLREHRDEYTYFRTDHHWTALGAYYVFCNFCELKGVTAPSLSEYQTMEFDGFLGSYYGQLQLGAMANNPDKITAYVPKGTNKMTYWDNNGSKVDYHVIADVTGWNSSALYSCFIAGDQPKASIKNKKVKDGSVCVLVKDSFGCAFAPFLTDIYSKVYIIDFRYFKGNIVDVCEEKGATDLIFLNNISMAGTDSVSSKLLSEIQ